MRVNREQPEAEIPTASMADITFMLIIFFILTAAFADTKGIDFKVPPPAEDPDTEVEQEDSILVRCDMPGVDDKKLNITLEDNELSITGEQTADARDGYEQLLGEYDSGVYHRTFTVTQDIDHQKIKAKVKDGVLELHLPKAEAAKPKKIKVELNA